MNHSWAKPGVKCVCLEDRAGWPLGCAETLPIGGVVYTIREVTDFGVGIKLAEILNEPKQYRDAFAEAAFLLEYFRPLVTRTEEQDVKLFKHLLSDQPVEERV